MTAVGLSAEQSAEIGGPYVDVETGEWIALSLVGGVLRGETLGDPFALYPSEERGVFRDGEDYEATVPVELRVELGPRSDDVTCYVNLGGQRVALRKCSPVPIAAEDLASFEGVYENDEIASRHRLRADGGRLVIEYGLGLDRGLTFPMEPIAPDIFLVRATAPGIAHKHVFRFERDADGAVTSVLVTMERLKGVRLRRAPRPTT